MSKTTSQKLANTLKFFKEAFCVDGAVRMMSPNGLNFKISSVIELNDSKRGKFYIAYCVLQETK